MFCGVVSISPLAAPEELACTTIGEYAAAPNSQGHTMASFKTPSFQDRVASADKAKQKALDQLKAKPPLDAALVAKQREAREMREQAMTVQRNAKAEANAVAKAEKAALKQAKIEEEKLRQSSKAARLKPASAADMKAARDARYAARKNRK